MQEVVNPHVSKDAAIVAQDAVAATTQVAAAIQHVLSCLLQLREHACGLVRALPLQHCKLLLLASKLLLTLRLQLLLQLIRLDLLRLQGMALGGSRALAVVAALAGA
jgi:hypothetical protein